MQPAIRQQKDYPFDQESRDAQLVMDPDEKDPTRQEFKDQTDPNIILKKFGVPVFTRQPIYGDMNFDLDLQAAMAAVAAADRLWEQLPKDLQEKYPDNASIITALDTGDLAKDLEAINNPKPPEVTPSNATTTDQ